MAIMPLAVEQRRTGRSVDSEALDVSVIIVNYNVREFLQQALRSVERATKALRAEIFVVDNNSVDGSVEMVRQEFPGVHILANEANLGFARANNQAIERARGRYLLILNPDTIVQEDTLEILVRFMDQHPQAGAAGCKILNPDGTFAWESRRSFPTPRVAFYRMTGLSKLLPRSRTFGRYNLSFLPIDAISEVDALSGSCMMVRRSALFHTWQDPLPEAHQTEPTKATGPGAGLLDEGFFMYGEDLDWCYRIQRAGWKIYYTPETQIIHYKGESTRKSEFRYVRLFHSAMLRFANKHLQDDYPRLFLWGLRLAVVARGAVTGLARALRRQLLLDLSALVLVLASLGWVRSTALDTGFPPIYYWLVAPGFAVLATGAIGVVGGYRGRGRRLGPVLIGVLAAVVLLAAASFFFKQIAFSRAVLLASIPAAVLVLAAIRLVRRGRGRMHGRTLFVGRASEALRLRRALQKSGRPPFDLVGYVETEPTPTPNADDAAPRLGTLHQLRDIVKLRGINDVVFASSSLSNKTIFTLMQRLHGLPAQCRILAEDRKHIIGKASIDDFSATTFLEAEDALGALRGSHRIFDGAVALIGALAHPLVTAAARIRRTGSFWGELAGRTRQWPDVFLGRRPLVGYRADEDFVPPPEWRLKQGVFAVTDALDRRARLQRDEAEQAYWYYVRNQSAFLDGIIVLRAIRLMG